jgi:RNA polymerase sigma-70 factor (ECF subfamily)
VAANAGRNLGTFAEPVKPHTGSGLALGKIDHPGMKPGGLGGHRTYMTVSLLDLAGPGDLPQQLAAHRPALRRFFGGRLSNSSQAEDATQETLLRALARRETLRDPSRVGPWLFGIARHVVSEERRRARRPLWRGEPLEERVEPQAPSTPELDLLAHEADHQAQGAILHFAEDRRRALLLRIEDELGYADIADRLGWSVPKVKNELHRARRVLKAALAVAIGILPLLWIRPAVTPKPNEALACFAPAAEGPLWCEPSPVLACEVELSPWCE